MAMNNDHVGEGKQIFFVQIYWQLFHHHEKKFNTSTLRLKHLWRRSSIILKHLIHMLLSSFPIHFLVGQFFYVFLLLKIITIKTFLPYFLSSFYSMHVPRSNCKYIAFNPEMFFWGMMKDTLKCFLAYACVVYLRPISAILWPGVGWRRI